MKKLRSDLVDVESPVTINCRRVSRLRFRLLAPLVLITAGTSANAADSNCLDTTEALEYWRPVKSQQLTQAAEVTLPADKLALELLPCLGSPNPELRDQIAYELYTWWLRNEHLSDLTRNQLRTSLSEMLTIADDDAVFARSFSSLILAELMRADARRVLMTVEQRQTLLDDALAALRTENDFRGLDENLGWVHPVAHMSDLLWRFALHGKTTAAQATAILDGVKHKVAPPGISYQFNESDRLARIVSALIRRDLLSSGEIVAWLEAFSTPQQLQKWSDAFNSPTGMAELHNTKQFLRALSDQLEGVDVHDDINQALRTLVQGFTQLV